MNPGRLNIINTSRQPNHSIIATATITEIAGPKVLTDDWIAVALPRSLAGK